MGRKAVFGVDNVAPARVFNLCGTAHAARIGIRPGKTGIQHHGRDLVFGHIGQLVPVGIKKLYAVVLKGIVRGRNNHTQIRTHAARQKRYGRGRQRTCHDDVHTRSAQPRREGGLKHIPRQARVLADNHFMLMLTPPETNPCGQPQTQGNVHRHRVCIHRATQTIRAEKTIGHAISFKGKSALRFPQLAGSTGYFFLRLTVTSSVPGFKSVMPSGRRKRTSTRRLSPSSRSGGLTVASNCPR